MPFTSLSILLNMLTSYLTRIEMWKLGPDL